MRRLLVPILCVALLAAACSSPGDEEVASVGDVVITLEDVSALFATESIPIDANFRFAAFRLIAIGVIEEAYAEEFGGVLDEAAIEERYQSFSADVLSGGSQIPEVFDMEQVLRFEARYTWVRDSIIDELVSGPELIDPVLAELEADPAAFTTVCVRHILTDSLEGAEAVADRLADGEDFAALAGEVSIDETPGGDLGCSAPGRYVPEFADATMAAEVGAVHGPVQSDFGYHVLIVDERTTPTAEDVVASPGLYLSGEEIQALWTDWLTARLGALDIEVNPEYGAWDQATQQIVAPRATE